MDISFLTLNYGWVSPVRYNKLLDKLYVVDKSTNTLLGFEEHKLKNVPNQTFVEFSNNSGWKTFCEVNDDVYFINKVANNSITKITAYSLAKNLNLYSPKVMTSLGNGVISEGNVLSFEQAAKQHRIPSQLLQSNSASCSSFISTWDRIHRGLSGSDFNQIESLQAALLRTGTFSNIFKKSGKLILHKESQYSEIVFAKIAEENVNVPRPSLSEGQGVICKINGFISII